MSPIRDQRPADGRENPIHAGDASTIRGVQSTGLWRQDCQRSLEHRRVETDVVCRHGHHEPADTFDEKGALR